MVIFKQRVGEFAEGRLAFISCPCRSNAGCSGGSGSCRMGGRLCFSASLDMKNVSVLEDIASVSSDSTNEDYFYL